MRVFIVILPCAATLDPCDRSRIVKRREFRQTIDRIHHRIVDHDRLSKLCSSMHDSMPDRVEAESWSFMLARLFQHLQHTLDRFSMG
jgi:hypothetical protein